MSHPWAMAMVMLLAGIGIPIMAALNGTLGGRLESPVIAAVILFAVALTVGCLTMLATGAISVSTFANTPSPMYFAGGLFVAFYVLSITWVAPRFGVGNAVFFVLLGQLVSTAAIDHFGLFGSTTYEFSLKRAAGIALMAAGVFLAVQKS